MTGVKQNAQNVWEFVKATLKEWKDDDCLQWGAALAYYAVFSLAPILLIAFALAGLFLDQNVIEEQFYDRAEELVGAQAADFVSGLTERAVDAGGSTIAIIGGILGLVIGATGAFYQLSVALNRIWGIRAAPKKGWLRLIKKRVLSLGFVVVIGFLMLVSLLADVALSVVGDNLAGLAPGMRLTMAILSRVVLMALSVVLFGLIFHYLPDARIEWSVVWPGAIVTALLFELGKYLFGLYIRHAGVASDFGAAGALVLILVWVWFASQILFLGAEFSQVYARRTGRRIQPERHAVRVPRPATA